MSEARHNNSNLFAYKPETWMDDAACIGYDPEWWFPDDRGVGANASSPTKAAKAICATCPVQTLCLDYAMRTEPGGTKHGIYGGVTADARRTISKAAS